MESGPPGRTDRGRSTGDASVCGGADNELELADRFTHVFLLEIDEPTMLARIDARQDNDWGRIGDTREYLRRKLPEIQDRLRAFGAIPIDARQPLDQVVDAILSHPLASSDAARASRLAPVVADRKDQLAIARVATGTGPPDQAPTTVHRAGAQDMPLSAPWAKPAGRGAVTSRQLRPFQASMK